MCNVSVCLSEKLKCRPKHVEAPTKLNVQFWSIFCACCLYYELSKIYWINSLKYCMLRTCVETLTL